MNAPVTIPARLSTQADPGGWGRLLELTPRGARVQTLTPLTARQEVLLSFELFGEMFTEARLRVEHAAVDEDGFIEAQVDFLDPLLRRKLAQALLEVLSR